MAKLSNAFYSHGQHLGRSATEEPSHWPSNSRRKTTSRRDPDPIVNAAALIGYRDAMQAARDKILFDWPHGGPPLNHKPTDIELKTCLIKWMKTSNIVAIGTVYADSLQHNEWTWNDLHDKLKVIAEDQNDKRDYINPDIIILTILLLLLTNSRPLTNLTTRFDISKTSPTATLRTLSAATTVSANTLHGSVLHANACTIIVVNALTRL